MSQKIFVLTGRVSVRLTAQRIEHHPFGSELTARNGTGWLNPLFLCLGAVRHASRRALVVSPLEPVIPRLLVFHQTDSFTTRGNGVGVNLA